MTAFDYTAPAQKIVSGTGAIGRLPEELAGLKLSRAILVCGASVRRSRLFDHVVGALGPGLVATFDRVAAHAPIDRCRDLAALAAERQADHFVTVGGGSASDTAKVAAVLLAEGDDLAARVAVRAAGPVHANRGWR